MKKKRTPATEPVIPSELLAKAKNSVHPDKLPVKPSKCVVCGAECAPTSAEQLCWVCRRLKISAWHESEQMPAQE
ncbi:MAG TPA: hypothetical protein VN428_05170 [Bryobacteraceae bacterium]|nr:hypothetical protein [Bryobacteraceae bacterium]